MEPKDYASAHFKLASNFGRCFLIPALELVQEMYRGLRRSAKQPASRVTASDATSRLLLTISVGVSQSPRQAILWQTGQAVHW